MTSRRREQDYDEMHPTPDAASEWLGILLKTLRKVHGSVEPLAGRQGSGEPMGRGAGGDVTRMIDKLAEDIIIDSLRDSGMQCTFIGEECGTLKIGRRTDYYVVADSIDGTTNAVRGVPFYCTSIGVASENSLSSIFAAAVFDHPRGQCYYGRKDGGAFLDGERINTSENDALEKSVIGVDLCQVKPQHVEMLKTIFSKALHTRHLGANALELCMVASGRADAFIDLRGRLRTTDVAAGCLLVKEAGGVVLDPEGRSLDSKVDPIQRVAIIGAANRELGDEILASLVR